MIGAVTDIRSPEGFKQMYRAELPYVLATLDRLGAPRLHREDLCHDVFMTAFDKRGDFDASRPLRPWLFGIAFRLLLNVRRKASMTGDEAALEKLVDPNLGPEEAASRGQAQTALMREVHRLEPERRAVFLLHDMEGHGAPEISRALDVPLNTVYSRLRLARQQLLEATKPLREGAHA
jgi:RNA polymerase sigma-70 factor (ECF subfamily)